MTLRKEKKSNENKNFETNFFFLNPAALFLFFSNRQPPLASKKKENLSNVKTRRIKHKTTPEAAKQRISSECVYRP